MSTYPTIKDGSVNTKQHISFKTDYVPTHASFCKSKRFILKEMYWIIIDYISKTRRLCVADLIKILAYFQGKGVPCTLTQERFAEIFNVSTKCVNETIQEMRRIGILHIRKFKDKNSQWLRNQTFLDPIMFTKDMVEVLYEQIDYCKLHKYYSLQSVILIQLNISSYQKHFSKVSEYWEKDPEFEVKTTQQLENDVIWSETVTYWQESMN